jgi:hypothetical protein
MTAREVLQYVGTDMMRKMSTNVWAAALIRQIKAEGSQFAIVTDVRFPNEVKVIQDAGGKVIKLTRFVDDGEDVHPSETALDPENYDQNNFDAVVDNMNMSIHQQLMAVREVLIEWDWFDENSIRTSALR